MVWLLLLPFRLLFGLVFGLLVLPFLVVLLPLALLFWVPFMLLRLTFRVLTALIIFPIVAVAVLLGLLVGGIALVGAILLPLIPLLFVAFCVWAVWRIATGPARPFPV
jgi:hypothetical protein